MRTNSEIDDEVFLGAMSPTGPRSKAEVVDTAMRTFVRFRKHRPVLALGGDITCEGELEEKRRARYLAGHEED